MDKRLRQCPKHQAANRNPKLGRRKVTGQIPRDITSANRPPHRRFRFSLVNNFVQLAGAHLDQRKLSRDKKSIQQNEHHNQSHLRHDSRCRQGGKIGNRSCQNRHQRLKSRSHGKEQRAARNQAATTASLAHNAAGSPLKSKFFIHPLVSPLHNRKSRRLSITDR